MLEQYTVNNTFVETGINLEKKVAQDFFKVYLNSMQFNFIQSCPLLPYFGFSICFEFFFCFKLVLGYFISFYNHLVSVKMA